MNIPQLIKEAHDNAVKKGFYDCPKCNNRKRFFYDGTENIKMHGFITVETCDNCGHTGINPNKNIGELLMLIVSELGEALEAHRMGIFAKENKYCNFENIYQDINGTMMLNTVLFESNFKDTFEDEIADVFIRLFDLCGYLEYCPKIIRCNHYPYYAMTNIGECLFKIIPSIIGISYEKACISYAISELNYFCQSKNIPIEKHILAKMAYNKTRPYKHGKEY